MVASEIMTESPLWVEASDTVRVAYDQMYQADIRHIPVLENGSLVGMLSDRDLKEFMLPPDEEVDHRDNAQFRMDVKVRDVARQDVLSANPDTQVGEIIELMLEHKVGALPIVEGTEGQLVGIISYVDVLKALKDKV